MDATRTPEQLIRAVDEADSPARLIAAVRELADARLEAGIPTLIRALGFNNPGAAVTAVSGLVKMGEIAVPSLLEQLDGYNYGARSYAIRALAEIADPRAFEILKTAAVHDFAPSVRRAAARGLGRLKWHQLPVHQVHQAQPTAWQTLCQVTQDTDWSIRYAAVVGFEGLAIAVLDSQLVAQILAELDRLSQTEAELSVRARAQVAQEAIRTARLADCSTSAIAP